MLKEKMIKCRTTSQLAATKTVVRLSNNKQWRVLKKRKHTHQLMSGFKFVQNFNDQYRTPDLSAANLAYHSKIFIFRYLTV